MSILGALKQKLLGGSSGECCMKEAGKTGGCSDKSADSMKGGCASHAHDDHEEEDHASHGGCCGGHGHHHHGHKH